MAKSRNRSRDIRKRAAKKRKNKEYQAHRMTVCPFCDEKTPKTAIDANGCCLNCWLKQTSAEHGKEHGTR